MLLFFSLSFLYFNSVVLRSITWQIKDNQDRFIHSWIEIVYCSSFWNWYVQRFHNTRQFRDLRNIFISHSFLAKKVDCLIYIFVQWGRFWKKYFVVAKFYWLVNDLWKCLAFSFNCCCYNDLNEVFCTIFCLMRDSSRFFFF